VEPKPWRAVKKAMGDGLDEFNAAASGGKPNQSEFIIGARNARGEFLGGFYCQVYFETVFLKWAWVSDTARRTGIGRALMDKAEKESRLRGAVVMYLDTFSFQARPFYQKLGFTVFGTLDMGRSDMKRYWMSKRL
jgi:GNAT superfamily N-acetyltransferase